MGAHWSVASTGINEEDGEERVLVSLALLNTKHLAYVK